MRNRGRPRHALTELVEELLAKKYSDRAIVKAIKEAGGSITRRTVGRIRTGQRQPSHSQLAVGERRVNPPVTCPNCRFYVTILPCRLCKCRGENGCSR